MLRFVMFKNSSSKWRGHRHPHKCGLLLISEPIVATLNESVTAERLFRQNFCLVYYTALWPQKCRQQMAVLCGLRSDHFHGRFHPKKETGKSLSATTAEDHVFLIRVSESEKSSNVH